MICVPAKIMLLLCVSWGDKQDGEEEAEEELEDDEDVAIKADEQEEGEGEDDDDVEELLVASMSKDSCSQSINEWRSKTQTNQ